MNADLNWQLTRDRQYRFENESRSWRRGSRRRHSPDERFGALEQATLRQPVRKTG